MDKTAKTPGPLGALKKLFLAENKENRLGFDYPVTAFLNE